MLFKMKRKVIVFVCRGNIARSPVAEFVLNQELRKRGLSNEYVALSRGVQGTPVDPKPVRHSNIVYYEVWKDARPALEALKIDISSHVSKPISRKIMERANIVLAMDKKTRVALSTLFPKQKEKIYLFSELVDKQEDVLDPEGLVGKEKQLRTYQKIKNTVLQGFNKLLVLIKEGE